MQLGEVEDVVNRIFSQALLLFQTDSGERDLVDTLVLLHNFGLLLDFALGDLVRSRDVHGANFALLAILLLNRLPARVHRR